MIFKSTTQFNIRLKQTLLLKLLDIPIFTNFKKKQGNGVSVFSFYEKSKNVKGNYL